jgi:hypothetical protein
MNDDPGCMVPLATVLLAMLVGLLLGATVGWFGWKLAT